MTWGGVDPGEEGRRKRREEGGSGRKLSWMTVTLHCVPPYFHLLSSPSLLPSSFPLFLSPSLSPYPECCQTRASVVSSGGNSLSKVSGEKAAWSCTHQGFRVLTYIRHSSVSTIACRRVINERSLCYTKKNMFWHYFKILLVNHFYGSVFTDYLLQLVFHALSLSPCWCLCAHGWRPESRCFEPAPDCAGCWAPPGSPAAPSPRLVCPAGLTRTVGQCTNVHCTCS